MATRRRKINYMGSLAEFKQSVSDQLVDGGGGAGGVLPGGYSGPLSGSSPDTLFIPPGSGSSDSLRYQLPYYRLDDIDKGPSTKITGGSGKIGGKPKKPGKGKNKKGKPTGGGPLTAE